MDVDGTRVHGDKGAHNLLSVKERSLSLQNTSAAVQCYNRALDLDPYDYRAWNGLGMLYDMLRLYNHAIYHYTQAHLCQ